MLASIGAPLPLRLHGLIKPNFLHFSTSSIFRSKIAMGLIFWETVVIMWTTASRNMSLKGSLLRKLGSVKNIKNTSHASILPQGSSAPIQCWTACCYSTNFFFRKISLRGPKNLANHSLNGVLKDWVFAHIKVFWLSQNFGFKIISLKFESILQQAV